MCFVLVLYFVVLIFEVAYGLPDLCVFEDYDEEKAALCGRHDVEHIFEFIPPIAQPITYIDFSGQPLIQLPYNGFRNLSSQSSISRLRLADCQISVVDAGALLYLHNLSNIDLSHNDIKQIDSKLFSHTKQIKFVYMEYNNIEMLPEGLFQNLLQLEVVHLHHNQIYQVEMFSFRNTPTLRIIDLNNNQISVMNMSFKDKLDNLTTLSLYGNPWKCNCELGALHEFLIELNRLNLYDLVCKEPSTLQGRNWSDISRDEFVCLAEDVISTTEHEDNIPVTVNVAISTRDSVMTSIESTTSTEQHDNVPATVYNVTRSTRNSVVASTESMTSTEQDVNITVTVYNGTRCQQVDSGIAQPPSDQNWIQYTILGLVLVCTVAVIIGVIFVVRHVIRRSDWRRNAKMQGVVNSENGDVDEEGREAQHLFTNLFHEES